MKSCRVLGGLATGFLCAPLLMGAPSVGALANLNQTNPGLLITETSKPGNSKTPVFDVEILDFSPVITTEGTPRATPLGPGEAEPTFSLPVRLHNTDTAPHRAFVQLWVQGATPVSRSGLEDWAAGRTSLQSARLVHATSLGAIAPGGAREVILTVPLHALPLGDAQQWGPRGFALTATPERDTDPDPLSVADENPGLSQRHPDPAAASGQARNWLVWDSGAGFDASALSIVTPVTYTFAELQAAYGQALRTIDAASTGVTNGKKTGQKLDAHRVEKLCNLAENPYVSTLIDPLSTLPVAPWVGLRDLLFSPNQNDLDQAPKPPTGFLSAPSAIQVANCGGERASSLPVGDFSAFHVNAASLPATQSRELSNAARSLDKQVGDLGAEPLAALALLPTGFLPTTDPAPPTGSGNYSAPARSSTMSPNKRDSSANGFVKDFDSNLQAELRLWPGRVPILAVPKPPQDPVFDPSAYRKIVVGGQNRLALFSDSQLSEAVSGQLPPDFSFVSGPGARQWLLAQTAVLTRQRPFDRRSFVASLGRDIRPEVLAASLQTLSQARWFSPVSLPDMLASAPKLSTLAPTDLSAVLPGSPPSQGMQPLGPAQTQLLGRSAQTLSFTQGFAQILPANQAFSSWAAAGALASASASFLTAQPAATTVGKGGARNSAPPPQTKLNSLDLIDRVTAGVSTQPTSTINLIDKKGSLPLGVSNSLLQPITVKVDIRPSDPRLRVDKVDVITVPPQSAKSAHIPLVAIGSGDLTLQAALLSAAGAQIYRAPDIQVRVRAQWETAGTMVVASLLAVVLVFGIVRNIRKGRRREKTS